MGFDSNCTLLKKSLVDLGFKHFEEIRVEHFFINVPTIVTADAEVSHLTEID
jgi:hypothetical protein